MKIFACDLCPKLVPGAVPVTWPDEKTIGRAWGIVIPAVPPSMPSHTWRCREIHVCVNCIARLLSKIEFKP